MTNFFHKLFNPHCPHCIDEARENRICGSCEILQLENERLRHEVQVLLDRILERPIVEPIIKQENLKPIMPQHIPFRVRKQMLESESREQAKLLRNQSNTIEELEKEMNIVESIREGTDAV